MNAPFPFIPTASTRQRVLDAIRWHFRMHGSSPSHEEIGKHARISPKRVHGYVVALANAGYLTFQERIGRSIVLIDRAAMLSDSELRLACSGRGWNVRESPLIPMTEAFPVQVTAPDPDADLLKRLL